MNTLNPTELEFAAALAKLTPASPTDAQKEMANELLLAFNQKSMAVEVLARELVIARAKLASLQVAVASAVAQSMRPAVPTSGRKAASPLHVVPEVDRG